MKLSFSRLSSPWRRLSERLSGWTRASRRSRRIQHRAPATRRPFLESLEDRTLLSGSPMGAGLLDLPAPQASSLVSSALLGGSGTETADSIAVDSAGNTYVVGSTDSPTFPGTDTANAGQADAFVSKLSPTGELLWSTLLGGDGFDRGMGIALGSSGDIYITGFTGSTSFPGTDPSENPSGDAFISKLSSDGSLLWTTRFGSSDSDAGVGITVDSSGNAYIVGYLYASTDSTTFPGTDETAGIGQRIFVSKFDSDGVLAWSSLLGGNAAGAGAGIAVDASGSIYITGNTSGATFPGTDQTSPGFEDAFVSKLSADGELLWSTRIGGNESDRGSGITLDASGNIYISGSTLSTAFPGTDQANAGSSDAFVSKLNASGELLWSTLVGGTRSDSGSGIATDASGNIYLTGTTTSPALPSTSQTNAGESDAFVTKLNADGKLLGSTFLGGDRLDLGNAIAVDSSGGIHIAGETRSSNFPGPNGTELAYAGLVDAFVATLVIQDETGNPTPVLTQLSQSSIVAGSGQFTLTVNGNGFIPDSKVQWNGTALATTYVSATQLTAVVPADYLTEAGKANVTVVNPAPGGGTSQALSFTVTQAPPTGEPTGSETPVSAPAAPAASEWNGLLNFYHYLSYQYLTSMGLDPLSSYNWGAIFAQFNVNLGTMRNASPLVSLILFNHLMEQGGDPYTSGILSTTFTGQGGSFTPAPGSPSERAAAYYESLGLPADELTAYYGYALGNGHPDDAIAAFIAAQHGTNLV